MIIGISGRKGSGKSSAARAILHEYGPAVCVELDFALPLKNLCAAVFGAPVRALWGSEQEKCEIIERLGMSGRQLLQSVGQGFREIYPDVWTELWMKEALARLEHSRMIVAADVRYPNEIGAVRALGGRVIRLERRIDDDGHRSECELDKVDRKLFDLVVPAEAGLDEMNEAILGRVAEWWMADGGR